VTEVPSGTTGAATAKAPATHQTVEALVRHQLSKALGGRRGMLEGAIPTLAFTVCLVSSHNLKLSLAISCVLAVGLLVARVVQRSSVQFVLNSAVGIAIAAVFALRSGRAEDAFLPGLIYNAAYGAAMVATVVVRWPLLGFMLGSITGDPTGWHRDRAIVRLCSKLTLVLAAPCVVRVIVQYPLWATHHAGWLGVAKLAMGWPLQVAALAVMAWMLNRDETPIEAAPEVRPAAG
jgi:uncharacterized protein DUF3159